MRAGPTDRCDDRQQETYTSCMRSFFVYVRLPILPGSWDKQRSAFKGAKRRIKATESLMSGPCVSSTCHEEVFMCADPTDRCDDRQEETYTTCMRSFFVYVRLSILLGSWDKQRAKFEGVRSTTRKLVRIAYVGPLT